MDRSQLIEALAAHYEGNRQAAAKALDSVVDTITREVSKGERVVITGFGAFEKAIRPARTVRDPATGEPVQGEETAVPRFHPGANLKAVVAGVRGLPALTLATAAHAAAAVTETAARAAGLGARKSPDEPGVGPDPSDGGVMSTSAPTEKAKGRSAAAPAARKSPTKKSPAKKAPAAKKPPARKSSPRQGGLDPTESTASFAPPALAEELHSGQATQAAAAAAAPDPAPPTAAPEAPVMRAPASKAAAKAAPSKKAAATAPAEAPAKKAAAKRTAGRTTAAKQTAAKTPTAKTTATKSATKKAGTKKAATQRPERASVESTDGSLEPSLPAALAEPPPPDTSSRPVLSLGPDAETATETETETLEATGPADVAQPGRS